YPTALYSGITFGDGKILATAREKKSVFKSKDGGDSWSEVEIGNIARSISYIEGLDKTILTSDNSIFLSSDEGTSWTRLNSPILGLALRYPTFYKDKLYMTGVGWRSLVISTNLNQWHLNFDLTHETGSKFVARMAVLNDFIFLGDELNGALFQEKMPTQQTRPIDKAKTIEFGLKYLISMANYGIRRIIG
ncbi:MAG: hypothetical protein JSW53_03840, partial [Candidatus Bathyarchaeota archaeon]